MLIHFYSLAVETIRFEQQQQQKLEIFTFKHNLK